MKRTTRTEIAHDTVAIVDRGWYDHPLSGRVVLAPAVRACLEATRLFRPNELARLRDEVLARPELASPATFEVRNETTLQGIARLVDSAGDTPVAALNFASAKNPGGGFLGGSQAQEESLARSSALYASLKRAPDYYDTHRSLSSCLYTDAMILSPGCPIFRDDDGGLLASPQRATFLTSAAPNAGAIATNAPAETAQIPGVFRRRAEYVLALAAWHGHETLVLGAWGCGVFRNDPALVARVFADLLRDGPWGRRFARVVFSVLDSSTAKATYGAFRDLLGI